MAGTDTANGHAANRQYLHGVVGAARQHVEERERVELRHDLLARPRRRHALRALGQALAHLLLLRGISGKEYCVS
jgi:hypothetical protein